MSPFTNQHVLKSYLPATIISPRSKTKWQSAWDSNLSAQSAKPIVRRKCKPRPVFKIPVGDQRKKTKAINTYTKLTLHLLSIT